MSGKTLIKALGQKSSHIFHGHHFKMLPEMGVTLQDVAHLRDHILRDVPDINYAIHYFIALRYVLPTRNKELLAERKRFIANIRAFAARIGAPVYMKKAQEWARKIREEHDEPIHKHFFIPKIPIVQVKTEEIFC